MKDHIGMFRGLNIQWDFIKSEIAFGSYQIVFPGERSPVFGFQPGVECSDYVFPFIQKPILLPGSLIFGSSIFLCDSEEIFSSLLSKISQSFPV